MPQPAKALRLDLRLLTDEQLVVQLDELRALPLPIILFRYHPAAFSA